MSKASAAYGVLRKRLFDNGYFTVITKLAVYQSVITCLLYNCETWILYRKHRLMPEVLHQKKKLRSILRIRWHDKVSNTEVLNRANSTITEALRANARLRWTGHVLRMPDSRLPKQLVSARASSLLRKQGLQREKRPHLNILY